MDYFVTQIILNIFTILTIDEYFVRQNLYFWVSLFSIFAEKQKY